MKCILRRHAPRLSAALLVSLLCGLAVVQAQTRNPRVISAEAGGVNFVSGRVQMRRNGETAWQRLTATDDLRSGDAVKTGADGLVEVLLNPGSYLRVGGDSEFELVDSSLDDLSVRISRGSAVVEATGYGDDDKESLMRVETPQASVFIVKSGIYRFNALATNISEVAVYNGRARVGTANTKPLRGSYKARIGGAGVEVAKFEKKDERDALDLWSKERAKEIAEVSRKLTRRTVNTLLASSMFDSYWTSPRYGRPPGAWIYNAGRNCYTFVPFSMGWSSPYGFSHTHILAWMGGACRGCNNTRGFGYGNPVDGSYGRGGTTSGSTQPAIRQPEPRMGGASPVQRGPIHTKGVPGDPQ